MKYFLVRIKSIKQGKISIMQENIPYSSSTNECDFKTNYSNFIRYTTIKSHLKNKAQKSLHITKVYQTKTVQFTANI